MPGKRSGGRLTTRRECAFPSLSAHDALQLRGWLEAAGASGIETVADLGNRPWPQPRPEIILGVFRYGERQACWVIAGQAGRWVAACLGDRSITEPAASLPEVLEQIRKVQPVCGSG